MPTTKDFKLEELSKYFHLPEKAVAKELGICLTSLKKLCRSYGITRWPFRKLKSIQRTLAKVQDESAQPGVSAQFSAAGLVLECGDANNSIVPKSETSETSNSVSPHNPEAAQPDPAAGMDPPPQAAAPTARVSVAKKRKPYQLGGRTLLLTEEEKSIYELTLGKSGAQPPGELKPLYKGNGPGSTASSGPPTQPSPPTSAGAAHGAPHVVVLGHGPTSSTTPSPQGPAFGCTAVGSTLQIRNWSILWTQEHLQKRLLEPLGGKSISITPQSNLATLHFETEKTAQRAELICRAAAAAAEKNLRLQRSSRQSSRGQSPVGVRQFVTSPTGSQQSNGSDQSSGTNSTVKVEAKGLGGGRVKLEIPASGPGGGSGSQGSGAALGGGSSPVFKSTPTTPPTSFTSYLFECPSYSDGGLGTLLLHPNTSQFDLHDSGGGCVEVPASSMMGGPDDMTVALMPASAMAGGPALSDSVEEEILASSDNMLLTRSPPHSSAPDPHPEPLSLRPPSSGNGPAPGSDSASAATILLGGAAQVLLSGQSGSSPPSPLLNPADMAKTPPATGSSSQAAGPT